MTTTPNPLTPALAEVYAVTGTDAALRVVTTDDVESFELTGNNQGGDSLLTCSDDCIDIRDGQRNFIKFTEDGSNDTIFSSDDGLRTTHNAPRGLSFSLVYDNTATSDIGFGTSNIAIDVIGDTWTSGEEIAITLTDRDANTNSLDADDLSILDSDQIIPTIRIGSPFTLAEANSIELVDGDTTDGTDTSRSIDFEVTKVSDILVLKDDDTYVADDTLSIELGDWSDVNDYLPQYEPSFKGTHIINYDISSIGGTGISLQIEGERPIPLVTGSSGTETLTDPSFNATDPDNNFAALYDDDGNIQEFPDSTASLVIALAAAGGTIADGNSIVIDIFSFGLEDASDNVNNAIYRLELAEDGDDSSDFIGTLEYVGINQINAWEVSTYEGIAASGDAIILISDDDSISVEYLDLDSTGGETIFTAGADTPTHSGAVSLDSDGYKVADTVTVTVEDADLNVDSGKADVYTVYEDQIEQRKRRQGTTFRID